MTATGATIQHGGNSAFYAPSRDAIQLPPFEAFRDKESYYATALHELTHWTKHEAAALTGISARSVSAITAMRARNWLRNWEPLSCAPTSASRRRSGTTTPPISGTG